LALLGPPLPAQCDLEREVARLLSEADQAKLSQVWGLGTRVANVGTGGAEGGEASEEALARAITASAEKLGENGRLAAARALIDLADGGVYGHNILKVLGPVFESESTDTRVAAMSLLGFDAFTRSSLVEALEVLSKNATSELVEPRVRVSAARALWDRGSDKHRAQAKQVLTSFLSSTDPTLRNLGALSLAEINDTSLQVGKVLRELAAEPTLEGRLAKSYLEREEAKRVFDNSLQRALANRTSFGSDEFKTLREIINQVRARHIDGDRVSEQFLLDNAARGMLEGLDRHTTFFTSEEYAKFFFDLSREYGGIGAFVNFDQDDDFSITRPIYSGPAFRAGLRSGDKILEVDGWETRGHSSDEIIAHLKGTPDTTVNIKVYRAGWTEPKVVPIQRAQIVVPSTNEELLPGGVGYIELVTFGANTLDELRGSIQRMVAAGAKGLVLDLRYNTGGFLTEARDIVELFVPGEQMVVWTEGRNREDREPYVTRDRAEFKDLPVVVLVNKYSASASEIVAGAMQDLERATIVGERTFGKGSVQQLARLRSSPPEPFEDKNGNQMHDDWEPYTDVNKNSKYDAGAHVKMTVSRYFLPSGRCVNKDVDPETGKVLNPDWGVTPHVEVSMRDASGRDAWKNNELFDLAQRDVFRKYVREHMPAHGDLFLKLADGDGGEHTRYPDFDQFYAGLDTKLSKDDIRRSIRIAIREEVADKRGKAYPGTGIHGDVQEDRQLQEGVRALLQKLGQDMSAIPEYQGLKVADAKETGK
jgi:carboxyl-terminal processing protease